MGLEFNDPTPIKLRPEDQADDLPALTFDLADKLRNLLTDAITARDLLAREPLHDLARTRGRLLSRSVELADAAGEAHVTYERLCRGLRAAGRL